MTKQEKRDLKNLKPSEIVKLASILQKVDVDKGLVELVFESNVNFMLAFEYSTITELAEWVGVDRSYIYRLLSGKYKIYKGKNVEYLMRIALHFQIDVYTLLFVDLRDKFQKILYKI